MKLAFFLGVLAVLVAIITAPPGTETDIPLVICSNCNADYLNWSRTMTFCADDNYLVYNPLAAIPYHERYGTYDKMPMCLFNQTVLANYSYLNLTAGEIRKLPKLLNMTIYNMTCIYERCNKVVAVDLGNGRAMIVWDNSTKREYIYPYQDSS